MVRAAVIWRNYGPYQVARAEALSRVAGVDTVFLELASSTLQYPWLAERKSNLAGLITLMERPLEECSNREVSDRLSHELAKLAPDIVVVSGYDNPAMRTAARWAKKNGRGSILMFAGTRRDRERSWWRELAKRWLIRRYFDSALVGGALHREYLVKLGMPPDRIWERGNVVDNDYFSRKAKEARLSHGNNGETGRSNNGAFLYVGRFSPEKNLIGLMNAYRRYRVERSGVWGLTMVGDGPQSEEIKGHARRMGLHDIRWPGYRQIEELPFCYVESSALILPSLSETWGLVVNEAMACGLPVMVSDRCGCAPDLVEDGRNGYTFDPRNVDQIADRMATLASLDDSERAAMGQRSIEVIAGYTPERWAQSLADCIAHTVDRRSGKLQDSVA